jgi:non-ribosomal peptide synthetase component F
MTMLAALALVIHRWSGQDDVVVGSPLAGRQWLESERMIGFFLNVLPMRIGFSGEPAFRGLLRRARQTALDAFAHQEVPFLSLIEELGLPADTSYSPLFQCTLNMLNFPPAPDELPGDIGLEPLPSGRIEAKYDFTLYAIENGEGGLSCSLVYNRDLFERPRMEALLDELEAVLEEAH